MDNANLQQQVEQLSVEQLQVLARRYLQIRDVSVQSQLHYDDHGCGPEFNYDEDLDAELDELFSK